MKRDVIADSGPPHRIRGRGLPDVRSHRFGDELVQVLIEVPRKLTERQKQLLKDFAGTEDNNAMPQRKSFLDKLRDLFAGEMPQEKPKTSEPA